jgi:hypothetical protein
MTYYGEHHTSTCNVVQVGETNGQKRHEKQRFSVAFPLSQAKATARKAKIQCMRSGGGARAESNASRVDGKALPERKRGLDGGAASRRTTLPSCADRVDFGWVSRPFFRGAIMADECPSRARFWCPLQPGFAGLPVRFCPTDAAGHDTLFRGRSCPSCTLCRPLFGATLRAGFGLVAEIQNRAWFLSSENCLARPKIPAPISHSIGVLRRGRFGGKPPHLSPASVIPRWSSSSLCFSSKEPCKERPDRARFVGSSQSRLERFGRW